MMIFPLKMDDLCDRYSAVGGLISGVILGLATKARL